MLKIYFGDLKSGKIVRLPYLGYSLLLTAIIFVFALGVVFAIGAAEHLIGGDIQQAQELLRQRFGILTVFVFVIFGAAVFFASINLMAKRLRDIGLPGWWSVLTIAVFQAVISSFVSQEAAGGLHTLIWLALLFIPSNTLGHSQG